MLGVHVPVTDSRLDDSGLIEVAHDYLGLTESGLEPGQLLILKTLDGRFRCAEVISLHFTLTRTVYRMAYGTPVHHDLARVVVESWTEPSWFTDETVLDLLGTCATLLAAETRGTR